MPTAAPRGSRGDPSLSLTDPDRWISICDAEGREIAVVEDPTRSANTCGRRWKKSSNRRVFLPRNRALARIDGHDPDPVGSANRPWPQHLSVKSDDEIRRFGPHKAMLIDAHGGRYVIEDFAGLDHASRRMLERYL